MINNATWSIVYYRRVYIMIINIILIGLYGLGLFVLHQHSRTGLLVVWFIDACIYNWTSFDFQFAWLVAILDIIATVAVLSILFVIIFLISPISVYSVEIFTGVFLFIILSIVGLVFMVYVKAQHFQWILSFFFIDSLNSTCTAFV